MEQPPKLESDNEEFLKLTDEDILEIMQKLSTAPVYRKQGTVNARLAKRGERIMTRLEDGFSETTNTANAGDWVVTNPTGESYIVALADFEKRYEPTDELGLFRSKGHCRAISSPFGKNITLMAPWGEEQSGKADCMIVVTCDAAGQNMSGTPYIIAGKEFGETYQSVSND